MISWLFGVFGRHPKACLVPVGLLAVLAGAELLTARFGVRFIPEPFDLYVVASLVLSTLALLALALAWWVHNRLVKKFTDALKEVQDVLGSYLTEIIARLVQDSVYNKRRTSWTADTQSSGHVYASTARPAVTDGGPPMDTFGQITQGWDPPTGEIGKAS